MMSKRHGQTSGSDRICSSIRRASDNRRPALAAFLTAGYPGKPAFESALDSISAESEVVEIGVPFSDPMADGVSIQESSRVALEGGVTLQWILECVREHAADTPFVLMGYLNPFLAYGFDRLAREARSSGIDGLIVPDLPYEESSPFREECEANGLALIQLVSPVTPVERLKVLCEASGGFVYAVTVAGVTGGKALSDSETSRYLDQVQSTSSLPVMAGFGIRSAEQVREVSKHVDGVVVGSALVEVLARNEDPAEFLRGLRPQTMMEVGTG